MSKYFNKEVIDELEKRFHRRINEPPAGSYKAVPEGDTYLLFVSANPEAMLSRQVITKTVQKICYDANLGRRCSVRIEGGPYSQDMSDTVAQSKHEEDYNSNNNNMKSSNSRKTHTIKPNQGSGDLTKCAPKQQIELLAVDPVACPQPEPQRGCMLEVSSFSDLFDSGSESDMPETPDGRILIAQYKEYHHRKEIYERFKSALSPTKIVHGLRSMARNCVKLTFGRAAPLECQDESLMSPTLFGPSIDEPLVVLADHIYRTICWLFEPESPAGEDQTQENRPQLLRADRPNLAVMGNPNDRTTIQNRGRVSTQ